MAFDDRKSVIREIESLRHGRRLISLCNFDREEYPRINSVQTQFAENIKEPLFRVLKETAGKADGVDLFLYTRGGEVNAVWPIACLLREFDENFEVLIPYRAHSSGTLLALAASKIVMGPLGELSPIDPTVGNQFNPRDNAGNPLGISVEDVSAFQEFLKTVYKNSGADDADDISEWMQPHLARLTEVVHPVALGNVHRVVQQISVLAELLMKKHYGCDEDVKSKINHLTTKFYSHHHMINRLEAQEILGADHVSFAKDELGEKLDKLLKLYEDNFALRKPFMASRFMGDDTQKDARLIGGCVESREWGYLYETKFKIRQSSEVPSNIQIQLQPGQTMPIVDGLPRKMDFDLQSRCWVRNSKPIGVDV